MDIVQPAHNQNGRSGALPAASIGSVTDSRGSQLGGQVSACAPTDLGMSVLALAVYTLCTLVLYVVLYCTRTQKSNETLIR